jgi:7-keto-8-aminopelargonate synthetase-like enzyme
LLFSTGYAANLGVLSTLGGEGVTIFSDELNHASIVDGCRLSRAKVIVYPHLDVEEVGKMMHGVPGRAVLVSETVFSMDGDRVPLDRLIEVCAARQALLVLDDAHGILGPSPIDAAARLGADVELILVGTLSKALGSLGGFVAASRRWVDWFVNRSRSFIYTTAPTPADCAAAAAALAVLRSDRGLGLVARLRGHVDALRPGHDSPILPVVLGDERSALDAASALLDAGLFVPAIRPPTVPAGTSRLRIAVSAAHTDAQVGQLISALGSLGLATAEPGPGCA